MLGERKPWTRLRCLSPVLPSYQANQSVVLSELYSRLNLHLERVNATAILSRWLPSLSLLNCSIIHACCFSSKIITLTLTFTEEQDIE